MLTRIHGLFLFFIGAASLVAAEEKSTFEKTTILLEMRDGVRLATDVYRPLTGSTFPVVLMRTPYNKNGLASFGLEGTKRGYAVVIQDTRGRNASEGKNLPYDGDGWGEHWDGFDTAEWIAAQHWCNGQMGTTGGSALSNAHFLLMGSGSSRIKAEHHTVGTPSLFHDVIFPGGVFKKFLIEEWLSSQKYSPEALQIWSRHPGYDDYWKTREARSRLHQANVPAVHIGGWFDIFAQATLDSFQTYHNAAGPQARGKQRLLMGPWTHSIYVDKAGELAFRNGSKLPSKVNDPWKWFDLTLKGLTNEISAEPPVWYYVMGDTLDPQAPGNEWRSAQNWPPFPANPKPFYFNSDRTLAHTSPGKEGSQLTYTYDPAHPVPSIGGYQNPPPNGPMDQRSIENREDVLVFTSEKLQEPLEITGRVRAHLWVSSDAPDTDFFVRLCDVYPDGRSFNICEGQLRARYRQGQDKEVFMKPGMVYPLDIDLWSTSIIFNKGHHLRVHVTSSSNPGYDPNPNTGEPFRSGTRFQKARNTIHVSKKFPSALLLPVRE